MANSNRDESQKNYGKVVAKAWTDDEFKVKLMSDPKAVFKENGVSVPEGMDVKIVENTPTLTHFTLPERSKAKGGELSDEQLDSVAGGGYIDWEGWHPDGVTDWFA